METNPREQLWGHEFEMSMKKYISQNDIVEELRLLANCMSTHKALADKIGISPAYLCDVLDGRRNPGPVILRFLKLKRVVVYEEEKL